MNQFITTGGSAFPRPGISEGATLRDYFAAKCYIVTIRRDGDGESEDFVGAAQDAYARADAMLAERAK